MNKAKFNLRTIVPYLGLLAIIIIFAVGSNGQLLTPNNLLIIFGAMFIYLIAALGSIFVFSIGALNFSLGSLVGVTATAAALVAQVTESLILCMIVSLAIGAATGVLIALLHNIFGLNPFIVSVTVMFAFRGLTWVLNNNGSTALPMSMYKYDNVWFNVAVLAVVFIIVLILFRYTKLGRYAKAVGSNEMAARQSGINTKAVKIIAFMLSGLFAGLAGVMTLLKAGSSFTTTGQMFECDVLIVMMLGGMPLAGGSNAKLRAPIIGAISYAILSNGLVLIGVPAEIQQGIKGAVLILIVALSYDRTSAAVID